MVQNKCNNVIWVFNVYGQGETEIKKGVRQGCPLSQFLFNLYVQEAFNRVSALIQVGIKIKVKK